MAQILVDPQVLGAITMFVAGLVAGYFARLAVAKAIHRGAEKDRDEMLAEAEREAKRIKQEIELQAKQELIGKREEFEREVQQSKRELRQTERRLEKREDALDEKRDLLAKKEKYLETTEKNVAEVRKKLGDRESELETIIERQTAELHHIGGLTEQQAREILYERLIKDVEAGCAETINKKLAQANEFAEERSRQIIVDAIERCAAECTSEATVTTIELPDDDLKGRIIGREGRNIRSFEKAAGVDVIVDDTPGLIVLSSFDSIRREVARMAMQKLISDGRIHPGRIEEAIQKAEAEMKSIITRTGKEVCYELDLADIVAPLKHLIGQLKFRTSFGQNALQHSVQVSEVAGLMASELGLDVRLARRCGLLHDIGKALNHQHEGSHAYLGAQKARQHSENELVINAIEAHHEECEATSPYAGLIVAADTVSASRPGARRETLERYIQRLERLERIATQHSEVQKAYAIRAGRELRVLVIPDKVSDNGASKLCHGIARELEKELQYPGEINVTVIRENRFTETAH